VNNEPQGRLHELDSLRGLAAFSVVLHHFGLMWPAWQAHFGPWRLGRIEIAPFYPLYAGHEAVMLFFVLSGLVLSLPYLRGRGQPYPIYLARRVLRIYAPYLPALALSVCGAAIWHGNHGQGTFPVDFWSGPVNPRLVLQHIAFIGVYDAWQFNFVIWSLIYEMRISILFPVLTLLIFRVRPQLALLFAGSLSLLALVVSHHRPATGAVHNLMYTFHYMAFFIFGILLAMSLSTISTWYRSLSGLARTALFLASCTFYYESSRIYDHFSGPSGLVVVEWGTAIGAVGFIIVAINSSRAKRLLHSHVPAFLGRISYSLYLIHAPLLLAITFGIHKRLSAWVQFPIYLAAVIGTAYVFCLCIEEPFTRMGQRLGRETRRRAQAQVN
jgi:peptidoglycan/LPS O-acetylase OafA/YrhL